LKGGKIVGHVPREISRYFWYFIGHGGLVTYKVTGRRKKGNGLEVTLSLVLLAKPLINYLIFLG
jgi:hypothetical protein